MFSWSPPINSTCKQVSLIAIFSIISRKLTPVHFAFPIEPPFQGNPAAFLYFANSERRFPVHIKIASTVRFLNFFISKSVIVPGFFTSPLIKTE